MAAVVYFMKHNPYIPYLTLSGFSLSEDTEAIKEGISWSHRDVRFQTTHPSYYSKGTRILSL